MTSTSTTDDEQERLTAAVELLEQHGPSLGRPIVDSLVGSRHPNMKELTGSSTTTFRPSRMRDLPMTQSERHAHSQSFDKLRKQIDADPNRRARVEEHKTAMLARLLARKGR